MAETFYTIDVFGRDVEGRLMREILRDCRCVKEIKILQDPMAACCKVKVTRIDTGTWEWNDEVISC